MGGRARESAGRAGLRGRGSECALVDELVAAIRRGESQSLVLRGEAGIGKTALLEYLIASAPGATISAQQCAKQHPLWATHSDTSVALTPVSERRQPIAHLSSLV